MSRMSRLEKWVEGVGQTLCGVQAGSKWADDVLRKDLKALHALCVVCGKVCHPGLDATAAKSETLLDVWVHGTCRGDYARYERRKEPRGKK